jgi:hypothetical protein
MDNALRFTLLASKQWHTAKRQQEPILMQQPRVVPVLLTGIAIITVFGLCAVVAQDPTRPAGDRYGSDGAAEAPRVYGPGGYGVVPGPPTRPIQPSRPASWPQGPAPRMPQGPPDPQVPLFAGAPIPFERAQMVARVSAEAILVSDILATLDELLERNADRLPPEQMELQRKNLIREVMTAVEEAMAGTLSRDQLTPEQEGRKNMLQQLLKQQVETKLVYIDAKKKIPTEHFPNVEKQSNKQFDQIEVKRLMKRFQVESWRELDQVLRSRGSSFERERRAFLEKFLSHEWLRSQVKLDDEVTFDQMLTYYHQHPTEFDKPARTRWQVLTVPFSKYPSKAEAYEAVTRMGNQILDGADFAAVAKAGGAGSDGSLRDWPDKNTVVSPVVEKAVLGLPAAQVSPVLEDWRGYHIVRVAERQPAYRMTFEAAQAEIREKVKQQRTQEQMQAYLNRLKDQTLVWTILDENAPRSRVAEGPNSSRR